ncbi:prepilin peptidase [Parasulfuritortus cantonensis]|uniref:Prepilin leader peptidase/N-methyltransferase n=1 Tax=Parasulfuritortus cantonensis TaxID=2528202 RepID=A0A4R1BGM1_9PROT|nr:A24 family peptidase [Parasulfuritortus cantonensis]TCJ16385.1 prepilin peptidase [Parasulfuritortus cantonensis]
MEVLAASPAIWAGVAVLLGLVVGSFLNVVIHRLPRMMEQEWQAQCAELRGEPAHEVPRYDLVVPRSACPSCGHAIAWHENIPVLSYLFLRGKCSACQAPISLRYPLVELATALLTGAAAWQFGFTWQAAAAFALIWALVALAGIDFDTQYLPDAITLPLLWLGLLLNLGRMFASLPDAVIGAVAGYLALWLVYQMFKRLTGKEGMGYGDFKLLAALGAWFGWTMLPLIILASSLVGAIVGIAMILLAGHDRARPIPFGPYLSIAGLVALFWGTALMRQYLGA